MAESEVPEVIKEKVEQVKEGVRTRANKGKASAE